MDHMYLLHYKVYGNDRFLPSWSERAIELGNPKVMDNATLIEWIERQLETEAETIRRHALLHQTHENWHQSHPGLWSCCINFVNNPDFEHSADGWRVAPGAVINTPSGTRFDTIPHHARLIIETGERVGSCELDDGRKIDTYKTPDGKFWDVINSGA